MRKRVRMWTSKSAKQTTSRRWFMSLIEIRDFLLCSLVINYGLLLVWFTAFLFGHEPLYQLHTRWFRLSVEAFDAIHYGAMAAYKIGILLFNLIPLIALQFVRYGG